MNLHVLWQTGSGIAHRQYNVPVFRMQGDLDLTGPAVRNGMLQSVGNKFINDQPTWNGHIHAQVDLLHADVEEDILSADLVRAD